MSYNVRDILASHGRSVDDPTVMRDLAQWQSDVLATLQRTGKGTDSAVRYGGTIPLNLLPYKEQVHFMGRYREIIGLDTVLSQLSGMGPGDVDPRLAER